MRILVIEDEQRVASLIKKGLEELDFAVTVATDGPTGKKLALSDAFHLVITDIMLPGMNGLELCRDIRKELPDIVEKQLGGRGMISNHDGWGQSMMGERQVHQDALFYEFSLERHVPERPLLRLIDRFVELDGLRLEVTVVLVASLFTTCERALEVLLLLLPSPVSLLTRRWRKGWSTCSVNLPECELVKHRLPSLKTLTWRPTAPR